MSPLTKRTCGVFKQPRGIYTGFQEKPVKQMLSFNLDQNKHVLLKRGGPNHRDWN